MGLVWQLDTTEEMFALWVVKNRHRSKNSGKETKKEKKRREIGPTRQCQYRKSQWEKKMRQAHESKLKKNFSNSINDAFCCNSHLFASSEMLFIRKSFRSFRRELFESKETLGYHSSFKCVRLRITSFWIVYISIYWLLNFHICCFQSLNSQQERITVGSGKVRPSVTWILTQFSFKQ